MYDMTVEKSDPSGGCPDVAIAAGRLLGCLRNNSGGGPAG